ncbi:MAG: hypothetical protein M5U05_10910 [Anaerolineales bacterium]|nr:hypothetical protein [Anaerolineales bacterium]
MPQSALLPDVMAKEFEDVQYRLPELQDPYSSRGNILRQLWF